MSGGNDWLPSLIRLEDYDGNWDKYINAVFAVFYRDFIETQPKFRGKWVRCRKAPVVDGKEAGFWHCVSEGPDEDRRTPDLRRCERIAWVRKIIENAQDRRIVSWVQPQGAGTAHLPVAGGIVSGGPGRARPPLPVNYGVLH